MLEIGTIWPELFPGGNCALFIKDFVCFQPGILTKRGKGRNGIFDGRPLSFGFVAVRIE